MTQFRTAVVATALAVLAACASKETKPAEPPAPAPVKAAAPPPAPKPAEVAAAPKVEPVKPEAPKAPSPAPVAPKVEPVKPETPKAATPAPAPANPPPPAAPAAKKKTIALGLPSLAALKDDVGMDRKQLKKCKEIYDSYKAKLDEAAAKVKAAQDKRAANKEVAPLRTEVKAKIREICADDAQKTKFDQLTAPKKKAAKP
jgi:hypothetical protein